MSTKLTRKLLQHKFLAVSVFCIIILALSLFVSLSNGQSGYSQTIYLDGLPSDAAYTIKYDGTEYFAITPSGYIPYHSTNASYVYNMAAASLSHTYQQKIVLTGQAWIITNTLIMYSYETLQIDTTLTLANGANCNMIQNANPESYNTFSRITGTGVIDCNRDNQSSGHGIYWRQASTIPSLYHWVKIENIEIRRCYDSGIYFDADGNSEASYLWLNNLLIDGCNDAGVNIFSSYDVHIGFCHIGGDSVGLNVSDVSSIYVDHVYCNQGMSFYRSTYGAVTNFRVDIGVARNGINVAGTSLFTFSAGNINAISTFASNSAVYLSTDSGIHSVGNCFSDLTLSLSTHPFGYGIQEATSSQDYNAYSNINGLYCTNYALRRLGANSLNSTIVGVIVEV